MYTVYFLKQFTLLALKKPCPYKHPLSSPVTPWVFTVKSIFSPFYSSPLWSQFKGKLWKDISPTSSMLRGKVLIEVPRAAISSFSLRMDSLRLISDLKDYHLCFKNGQWQVNLLEMLINTFSNFTKLNQSSVELVI